MTVDEQGRYLPVLGPTGALANLDNHSTPSIRMRRHHQSLTAPSPRTVPVRAVPQRNDVSRWREKQGGCGISRSRCLPSLAPRSGCTYSGMRFACACVHFRSRRLPLSSDCCHLHALGHVQLISGVRGIRAKTAATELHRKTDSSQESHRSHNRNEGNSRDNMDQPEKNPQPSLTIPLQNHAQGLPDRREMAPCPRI